jgi:hypothetical protein
MSKKHMGSSIDDFLKEEGIFEEAQSPSFGQDFLRADMVSNSSINCGRRVWNQICEKLFARQTEYVVNLYSFFAPIQQANF